MILEPFPRQQTSAARRFVPFAALTSHRVVFVRHNPQAIAGPSDRVLTSAYLARVELAGHASQAIMQKPDLSRHDQ